MHPSSLAFISPLLLSVACFLAGGVWFMLWTRARSAYMLPSAVAWWLLSAYFGMLTISGGPDPIVTRGDITQVVRGWGLVAAGVILASKALLLRAWWRSGRRNST